jgi:glutaredoxin domain-containing cysteine-rich protein 1
LQNALGEHVGNAEEIKLLNESGELENILKDFPIKDSWLECESCGDARFVPCSNCNGRFEISSKHILILYTR